MARITAGMMAQIALDSLRSDAERAGYKLWLCEYDNCQVILNVPEVKIVWDGETYIFHDFECRVQFGRNYDSGGVRCHIEVYGDPGHPHALARDSHMCLGPNRIAMQDLINQGLYSQFLAHLVATLGNYNSYDAYHRIGRNRETFRCSDCEATFDDNEYLYSCDASYCDRQSCGECHYSCDACDNYVCGDHIYRCESRGCDVSLCGNHSYSCVYCGEIVCEGHRYTCSSCGDTLCECCHKVCLRCDNDFCNSCLGIDGDMCESCQQVVDDEAEEQARLEQEQLGGYEVVDGDDLLLVVGNIVEFNSELIIGENNNEQKETEEQSVLYSQLSFPTLVRDAVTRRVYTRDERGRFARRVETVGEYRPAQTVGEPERDSGTGTITWSTF